MAAYGPDTSDLMPTVGDIVERNVDTETSEGQTGNTAHVTSLLSRHESTTALRPIQAVVGQAFPLIRTRRSYGRQRAPTLRNGQTQATGAGDTNTTFTRSSTTALNTSSYMELSAHIQPQDGISAGAGAYGDARASGETSHTIAPRLPIPEGGSEPMLPAGGSAQQHLPAHQWSAAEFQQLRLGYYAAPVPPLSQPSGATTAASPPTGENFFTLLFQCLRSTVRKHQQLALEVLLAHLHGLLAKDDNVFGASTSAAGAAVLYEEATALRERCLHGPDCGPFLFFLLEILVSAGHPAMIELTATCLLLLLRGLPRGGTSSKYTSSSPLEGCGDVSVLTDAISELGNPAGDAPGGDEGEDESDEKHKKEELRGVDAENKHERESAQGDTELPFSEVSELLRGPDARYGLEQLGFTNGVLAAMHLLIYTGAAEESSEHQTSVPDDRAGAPQLDAGSSQRHSETSFMEARLSPRHGQVLFLELLLCGGVGVGQHAACRRVAEDPHFLKWMEEQLSLVVLGHCSLEDVMELLCVLQHLAHAPAALHSLMRGGPDGDHKIKSNSTAEGTLASRGGAGTATTSTSSAQQHQHQRFHETWLLFFTYVCSTAAKEVRTVRQVFAIVWSMLLLRLCVQQNRRSVAAPKPTAPIGSAFGLVHDMSATLLADGMEVGGALVLEMWLLQYRHAEGCTGRERRQPGSLDSYFLDAARTALQRCRKRAATTHDADRSITVVSEERPGNQTLMAREATAAQSLLHELQWLSNAHFVATYITHMRQWSPATCYTFNGTAVETQEVMRDVVRHVVMDTTRIKNAFARFTSPLLSQTFPASKTSNNTGTTASPNDAPSPSLAFITANTYPHGWVPAIQAVLRRWVSPVAASPSRHTGATISHAHADASHSILLLSFSPRNVAVLRLAFEAAGVYANTRLAVALADVYPAVARDIVLGYATLLTHAYEEAYLRLRGCALVRLQVDELCTMAEAVQFLQSFSDRNGSSLAGSEVALGEGDTTSKTPVADACFPCSREARVGAFLLLHSIAISKHCLDVVPLILPLLQLHVEKHTPSTVSLTSAATFTADAIPTRARMTLLASIQSGIELTPMPVVLSGNNGSGDGSSSAATLAVTGAPRSWVMYPLYDNAFVEKSLWALWLRGLLSLHHRLKDVVGWDGVLCHTLLWMLVHRQALWAFESAERRATPENAQGLEELAGEEKEEREKRMSAASADALCALIVDLCAVLHDQSIPAAGGAPREGAHAAMSAAASRTLEISLAAYSDVPSEEGLPLLLHAILAYVAAHCSARTALAALQVLLATPVLSVSAVVSLTNTEESTKRKSDSDSFQYALATTQVCAWLQSWSVLQGQRAQAANGTSWSLDDVVALVQLVGPHLNSGRWDHDNEFHISDDPSSTAHAWSADDLWCVRCLTDGLLRYYLRQRTATSGDLSAMEKAVLRSTLEELGWFPSVLWPQVEM